MDTSVRLGLLGIAYMQRLFGKEAPPALRPKLQRGEKLDTSQLGLQRGKILHVWPIIMQ